MVIIVFSRCKITSKVLPMASSVASKVLPGLGTGAWSSLDSFGLDKILGQGVQTGGLLIPQDKIAQLIAYKHLHAISKTKAGYPECSSNRKRRCY